MTITIEEAERIAEDAAQALSAASTSRPRYMPGAGGQTLEATAKSTLRQISDWHLEPLFEAVHAIRTLAEERERWKERAERAEAEAERLRGVLGDSDFDAVLLREALIDIDALDPEHKVSACSASTVAALVGRMGDIARNALLKSGRTRAALEGGDNADHQTG